MISTTAWIGKGIARENPDKFQMDDGEYERICKLAQMQISAAKNELEGAKDNTDNDVAAIADDNTFENDPELAEYKLDEYDDEDEDEDTALFNTIGNGLAVYKDNTEDPYITLDTDKAVVDEDEVKDERILPSDNLLVVGKTEDEISHLEIYVYNGAEDDLYVHHDIMLPSFPLCVEPINFDFGTGGSNFCAVGTFQSEIEIWNLDVTDVMYPHTILGIPPSTPENDDEGDGEKKKKNNKKKKAAKQQRLTKLADRHTAAVMGLSWNCLARNLLASSSADTTVKLWDLTRGECVKSYEHHSDKVAVVQFNPSQATVMITAGYDKSICALDARAPEAVSRWQTESDVECLRWDPHQPACFAVSYENGLVHYYDGRQVAAPLFTLSAHSLPVSALDFNPKVPGMLLTGSADRTVKVWDIKDNRPTMACSRDVGAGKVFSMSCCPDSPYHVAIGGSLGTLSVWNITENAVVRKLFKGRLSMDAPGIIQEQENMEDNINAGGEESVSKLDEEESDDDDRMEMEETIEEMKGAAGSKY